MSDYYHELSGSPEASLEYETAVEGFTEAMEALEPDRDDEDARAAWKAALDMYVKDLR